MRSGRNHHGQNGRFRVAHPEHIIELPGGGGVSTPNKTPGGVKIVSSSNPTILSGLRFHIGWDIRGGGWEGPGGEEGGCEGDGGDCEGGEGDGGGGGGEGDCEGGGEGDCDVSGGDGGGGDGEGGGGGGEGG